MDNKIDGVSGNTSVPRNRSLVPVSTPDTDDNSTVLQTPAPKIKPVDPWIYPSLLTGLRNSFLPFENLEKFISWQRKKLEKNELIRFRNAVKVNNEIKGAIEDLIPIFFKSNANLMAVLKNRLIKSTDFEEKIILLKVFFSMESEDELFNPFLLPALEQRQGSENIETNHEFCMYFLSSLDQNVQDKILSQLDLGEIIDIEAFSKSILKLFPPEQLFDSLMKINEKLILNNDNSPKHREAILKIQSIIVICMNGFEDKPEFVSVEHLQTLYKTGINADIRNKTADLLIHYYPAEATELFIEQMSNTEDTSIENKQKRFSAIGHFVNLMKEKAVPKLKEVLDKEKADEGNIDEKRGTFIAGLICHKLANSCGVDGKRALIDLIAKQIRECRKSIALGCTIQLAQYMPEMNKILKNILLKHYETDEGLKKAFENLENINFDRISKSNEGTILFYIYTTPLEDSNLTINFIKLIGLKELVEWASNSKEKLSLDEEALKSNSLEVLQCAYDLPGGKMINLILETMPLGYSELETRARGLAAQHLSGDEEMLDLSQ